MEKSAAFYLFHTWIGWRVPEYATLTSYATSEHGLFLPEDKKKAQAILLNQKTIFAHPCEVAEYLGTGMPLAINDPTDAKRVYGWIMEHMADWLTHMNEPQLMKRSLPIEGLRQFNQLANKLFPVAHRYGYYKKPEVTMSSALQGLFTGRVETNVETHRFNDTLIARLENFHRFHQSQGARRV